LKLKIFFTIMLFLFVNPCIADENVKLNSLFEKKITPISGIVLVCKVSTKPIFNKPFCDDGMFQNQMNITRIHFVTREMLKEILDEKKLSLSGLTSKQQYKKIESISGASHILDYNIVMDWDNNIITKMKLINIQTSEIEYSTRLSGDTTVPPLDNRSPLMEYTKFFKMLDRHAAPETKTEAAQTYNRNIDKVSATEWLERGYEFANSDNFADAVNAFSKAIELSPQLTNAYYNRGRVYDGLGNYQQAIKDFNKVIELSPQFADAYNYRGIVYFRLGNNQKGFDDVKIAARLGLKMAQDFLSSNGIEW